MTSASIPSLTRLGPWLQTARRLLIVLRSRLIAHRQPLKKTRTRAAVAAVSAHRSFDG